MYVCTKTYLYLARVLEYVHINKTRVYTQGAHIDRQVHVLVLGTLAYVLHAVRNIWIEP